jgi:hypothetical protein
MNIKQFSACQLPVNFFGKGGVFVVRSLICFSIGILSEWYNTGHKVVVVSPLLHVNNQAGNSYKTGFKPNIISEVKGIQILIWFH